MNKWYDLVCQPRHWCVKLRLGFVTMVCVALCTIHSNVMGQDATTQAPASKAPADKVSEASSKSESQAKAAEDEQPPMVQQPTLALVGAEIHTLGGAGVIEKGVILIAEEKIFEVGGPDLKIPEGLEQLDVSGLILTPGLIDASSQLWLTDAAADSTASDASLNVIDGIDQYDEQWHEVIRHGVTTVYVQPGSRGALSGYGAVLSVTPGLSTESGDTGPEVLSEFAALQASFGIAATSNQARTQQFDRTKKAFKDAAEYQEKWDKYNAYVAEQEAAKAKSESKKDGKKSADGDKGEEKKTDAKEGDAKATDGANRRPVRGSGRRPAPAGDKPADSDARKEAGDKETDKKEPDKKEADKSDGDKPDGEKAEAGGKDAKQEKPPEKPEVDEAKERLARVVNGAIPVRLEIHTADDAHFAHELLKEFPKLQVVFAGVSDLRSATKSVVELTAPVVLGPWLTAESNYRSDPDSSRVWADAFDEYKGALVIASNGTSSRSSRLLRAHVGRAIAAGIDPNAALAAVTANAARALGVDEQVGSIEAGKHANLACFAGHPTDPSAPVALVIAAGKVAYQADALKSNSEPTTALNAMAQQPEMDGIGVGKYAIRTQNYLLPDGTTAPRTLVIDSSQGVVVSVDAVDAKVDSGVTVIDVGDAWVTPGLFSSHATLGLNRLVDPGLSDATYVAGADAITAGFEGESKKVNAGLLRVLLSPGDASTIAGCASLIRLGAQSQVMNREAAVKFTLADAARSPDRFPSSLAGQLQLIKESLAGQLLDTRLYLPKAVQARLDKQRSDKLISVKAGETMTLLAVASDADIRAALDLIEQQNLKAALAGAVQLAPFVDRLKALDVTIITRPVAVADYNWYAEDLALAAKAGVKICFAGEDAEQLRLTAALATETGMPTADALAGLCFGPSGMQADDSKFADLVIWSQSPLNLAAKPLCVIVDGEVVAMDLTQRGSDEK